MCSGDEVDYVLDEQPSAEAAARTLTRGYAAAWLGLLPVHDEASAGVLSLL